MKSMLRSWEKSLNELSGNFTTNESMPKEIKEMLLKEDTLLSKEMIFEELNFPKLKNSARKIKGLNILSGLQSINKKECLTLFRVVRFPTIYRIHKSLCDLGFTMLNYEQERILSLYKNKNYISRRKKIQKDKNFWIQPQERVVNGLPTFYLVNDALQIHRAFRSEFDRVMLVSIHIPFSLIKNGKIKIYANLDIDENYKNNKRDVELKDFIKRKGSYFLDTSSLNLKGINVYEIYIKKLPFDIKKNNKLGIFQRFFLLELYKIKEEDRRIRNLRDNLRVLKKSQPFLYGFFGDYNLFGRRHSEYLPYKCYEVKKKIEVRK